MRTYGNLMLTMTIGGLWHGAKWTFVLWGVYHGMLLSGERMTKPAIDNVTKVARQAMTFFLVVIGWTIFRRTICRWQRNGCLRCSHRHAASAGICLDSSACSFFCPLPEYRSCLSQYV